MNNAIYIILQWLAIRANGIWEIDSIYTVVKLLRSSQSYASSKHILWRFRYYYTSLFYYLHISFDAIESNVNQFNYTPITFAYWITITTHCTFKQQHRTRTSNKNAFSIPMKWVLVMMMSKINIDIAYNITHTA